MARELEPDWDSVWLELERCTENQERVFGFRTITESPRPTIPGLQLFVRQEFFEDNEP
jgi:hypothetical protein